MAEESPASPEYVLARRLLLDALELLDPHRDALVLIGAQAVYHHVPGSAGTVSHTTDSDLALDPDLLAKDPDIESRLESAGFVLDAHRNPGHWLSPDGVALDLMVPAGALPQSTRRRAALTGHGHSSARRTPGIELALVDNAVTNVRSLDANDVREADVRVAGPAALVVAKIVKLRERVDAGVLDRILPKDVADLLRLLRGKDASGIGEQLRLLADEDVRHRELIAHSLNWFGDQLAAATSELYLLAAQGRAPGEAEAITKRALGTFGGRMLDAYRG